MNQEATIVNYFISRVEYYKNTLLKPIKEEHQLTKFDRIDYAYYVVLCDIMAHTGISLDAGHEFMQTIVVEELLK